MSKSKCVACADSVKANDAIVLKCGNVFCLDCAATKIARKMSQKAA